MTDISSRPTQYLISQQIGFNPLSSSQNSRFEEITKILEDSADITVHRTIKPRNLDVLLDLPGAGNTIIVASMPNSIAQTLLASQQVTIEPDANLNLADPIPGIANAVLNPSELIPFGSSVTYKLLVTDKNGKAIEKAAVYLYGDSYPAVGTTNSDGKVNITLQNQSSSFPGAIYVNPQFDYWNLWVQNPQLVNNGVTTIALSPLSESFPTLATEETFGWGQIEMGLDKVPSNFRGQGIKIAVIDSGAASLTHPELANITRGSDLTVNPPGQTWTNDTIAHGSHCAGVITGSADSKGIRGFAPDAEVHALKIFPGGRFSSLLDALDYCIDNDIDVVNMSLGSQEQSEIILQKISLARQRGVACIVAAGNSGGAVQFPGTSNDVLTVSAIGMRGTFPESTYHAQQIGVNAQANNSTASYFSARFTCFGDSIDVCGPGVAVLSTVPDQGYAAWDGTSMAAPHIAGMAALILAHHPEFAAGSETRNADRVSKLFQIIIDSATPVNVGNVHLTGAGLPNINRALQISPSASSESHASESLIKLLELLLAKSQAGGQNASSTLGSGEKPSLSDPAHILLKRIADLQSGMP